MKNSTTAVALTIVLAAVGNSASAATLNRAATSAEVLNPNARAPAVQVDFASVYRPDRPTSIVADDVIVTWQQVGGIEPTPFRVLFPAGCFVEGTHFRVRDFQGCGAVVDFGEFPVEVMDLEARIIVRDNGTLRLDMRAGVIPAGATSELLGSLGGARVDVAIGSETAGLLPRSIESLSGIQPTPF